jgi:hypothetical protein
MANPIRIQRSSGIGVGQRLAACGMRTKADKRYFLRRPHAASHTPIFHVVLAWANHILSHRCHAHGFVDVDGDEAGHAGLVHCDADELRGELHRGLVVSDE